MIVKLNGNVWLGGHTDGTCKFVKDTDTFTHLTFDCSDVKVPDLSYVPDPNDFDYTSDYLISKIDHINYSVMSKTDITEFLYRVGQHVVKTDIEGVKDFIDLVSFIF